VWTVFISSLAKPKEEDDKKYQGLKNSPKNYKKEDKESNTGIFCWR